jgi:TRAP-type C4-dicarboxylate transport system substrate-binding protein
MTVHRRALLASALLAAAAAAQAQTKWDLPAAYPATNFHTVNLTEFAADVDKATGGKLKITVHANASLFKAPEIKRAVQGGQAQIGEILLVNYQNEWQIFGADGLPFLADSYDEAVKLWKVQKPVLDKKLAEQGLMALYAVPWPPQGIYAKKPVNSAADLKGMKWRAYSPATGAHRRAGGRAAGHGAGGRAQPGDGHRASSRATCPAAHRLRHQDLRAHQVLVRHPGLAAQEPGDRQQGGLRRAGRGQQGGGAEGGRRRRDARLAASRKTNTDSLDKLKANGMQIHQPSAQLKADMKKVGDTMLKEWLAKAGRRGPAAVDAFRK